MKLLALKHLGPGWLGVEAVMHDLEESSSVHGYLAVWEVALPSGEPGDLGSLTLISGPSHQTGDLE